MRLVYRELRGVELPCHAGRYVTAADRRAIAGLIVGELGDWVDVAEGEERGFDAVLIREGRFVRHIGVVVDTGRLLHVFSGETSRIERYRSGRLQCRITGFYRYRDHE